MKRLVVTIDGPSGSGKSTAARNLAKRLGFLYLDTGAMYRAVGLKALKAHVPLDDKKTLAALAGRSRIRLQMKPGKGMRVFLDGSDVTPAIRRPGVDEAASIVAAIPAVRRALVRQQQAMGRRGGVVAEGRDTGTVVFPRADVKFFLKASVNERARRRFHQLRAAGQRVSLAQVLRGMRSRDLRDTERAASPLRPARGAIWIDNTALQSAKTLGTMLDYVRRTRK